MVDICSERDLNDLSDHVISSIIFSVALLRQPYRPEMKIVMAKPANVISLAEH